MSDWKKYLTSIYFDPKHPASYYGPKKLYDAVKSEGKYKIGLHRIRKWLQDQETYSLTRGARRKFPRSRVIVEGLDSQFDSDLMDMANISKQNDGYKYILIMIDIFSRKLWCRPLKNKTGLEVAKAMASIFDEGRVPRYSLRTDRGMEYRSKEVQKLLKERGIHHILTQNETKANYAERVIKTIKHKLFRYIIKHQNHRYIDKLNDVVKSYNTTKHRSLGATPNSITQDTQDESRLQQYLLRKPNSIKNEKRKLKFKYKIGEIVRISHLKAVFDREYSQKWTGELFKVKTRYFRQNTPVYTLEDWHGEKISGTFYQPELQPVHVDENTTYKIEKVIRKRKRGGHTEVLIKWLHWPKKYNSWIPENEVQDYQKL